jgi:hypothetical protein
LQLQYREEKIIFGNFAEALFAIKGTPVIIDKFGAKLEINRYESEGGGS